MRTIIRTSAIPNLFNSEKTRQLPTSRPKRVGGKGLIASTVVPTSILTTLVYNNSSQGTTSFLWSDSETQLIVRFISSDSEGNYYYSASAATTTSIPSSPVPGNTNLIQVIIGNSVTSIGDAAFLQCTALTSVTIGNSVTSIGVLLIGTGAFQGCSALTSVTFTPTSTLGSIGASTFQECYGLRTTTIPNSVTYIEDNAFSDSVLNTVTIANNQLPGIPSPNSSGVAFFGVTVHTVLP